MDEASVQFHIEENDYFGTLATVLDLVSQDLRKKGELRHAETLLRLRDRLMHLQRGYRIEKIELITYGSLPPYLGQLRHRLLRKRRNKISQRNGCSGCPS